MKTTSTTDWNLLLSNKCSVKTLNEFAKGDATTKGVTSCLLTRLRRVSSESSFARMELLTLAG